jgi:diguanylate cyclase
VALKKWISKMIRQLDGGDNPEQPESAETSSSINEDQATLIYIIDTYSKHLHEMDNYPIRVVRQTVDDFLRQMVKPSEDKDKVLFRFRQFFSKYRMEEYTYVQKTFEDFREIIWDFIDQISDEIDTERVEDRKIGQSIQTLKETIEANSIEDLKEQSRLFIDQYTELQSRRESRREKRLTNVKKTLETVKSQLTDANENMRRDHMTKAFNRKSFDEHMATQHSMFQSDKTPSCLLALDIDHFKKFNDTYGHATGDFILIECVKLLKNLFPEDNHFVARTGGEEFSVVLASTTVSQAQKLAKIALQRIRDERFIEDGVELRFTMSMGLAQLMNGESVDVWMKRADEALYKSKQEGRNRLTLAPHIVSADDPAA